MANCNRDSIPQHVAIVMDGNGRWAKQRGLPRLAGHWKGEINAHRVVEILLGYGIKYVTLYVFSTENWGRPDDEVKGIFQVLLDRIDAELEFSQRKGIKLCHLGKLDGLPSKVRRKIEHAVEMTRDNEAMTVSLAINYGGRDEIIKAPVLTVST